MEKSNFARNSISVENFVNSLALKGIEQVFNVEKKYEIKVHEDSVSQKRIISGSGFITIDNMDLFLREINSHWQNISDEIQKITINALELSHAGSSFYNLIAVMSAEHQRK